MLINETETYTEHMHYFMGVFPYIYRIYKPISPAVAFKKRDAEVEIAIRIRAERIKETLIKQEE